MMPTYPDWLEAWWLDRLCDTFGRADRREALLRLEPEVRRLSDLLTRERARSFGNYTSNQHLLLAYGLFFFPQTFVRIQYPLMELLRNRRWIPPGDHPLSALDLGAGLGATSLGLATFLENQTPLPAIAITAADQALPSLALFRRLARDLEARWPRTRFRTETANIRHPSAWPPAPGGGWDLITIGFALNEVFLDSPPAALHAWARSLLERLSPAGLLIVTEPSLQETSERLEALRDEIAREGRYFIRAPCPHAAPCPLRAQGRYWCHEVRKWKIPESLATLNRHLHREIQVVKFSFLAVGRSPPPPAPASLSLFRLVSPLSKMKGRFLATGCAADGHCRQYEFPTRGLDDEAIRKLRAFERGDILDAGSVTPVGEILRVSDARAIRAAFRADGSGD